MSRTRSRSRLDKFGRMQFNLKFPEPRGLLLRQLAKADGRTISGFIDVYFLIPLAAKHNGVKRGKLSKV